MRNWDARAVKVRWRLRLAKNLEVEKATNSDLRKH